MDKAAVAIRDRTGHLRLAGAFLVASGALVSSASADAQTTVTGEPRVSSVVFQEPSDSSPANEVRASPEADPPFLLGIGGSLVYQIPQGNYATDHGNEAAFGYSLQLPFRRSRTWNFVPTYTSVSSTPGPSKKQAGNLGLTAGLSELEHQTKSLGLDVHWRGRNPGVAYLLFGGGVASVRLDAVRTECTLGFACHDSATNLGSKSAPYAQVGFGLDGGPGETIDGGLFFEARWWRGPYLQPILLADGTLARTQARTGNAVLVSIGIRMQMAPR